MPRLTIDARSQLDVLKKYTEKAYQYYRKNYKRYNDFVKFIVKTNLTGSDISVLTEMDRPQTEFNILYAHLARLEGEFAMMDPQFSIRKKAGSKMSDDRLPELIEAHLKADFFGADQDSFSQEIFRDCLRGGFSVGEIYTDWTDNKSFLQKIFRKRVFDPTLCGFDPLARESHKGDGRFCFQFFPRSEDEAMEEFGPDIVKGCDYTRTEGGFNWSYYNQNERIILFCEFFLKNQKKEKILKLANGHIVTKKEYERVSDMWYDAGYSEQIPAVLDERYTMLETIDKYTFTGNEVVKHEKTDYEMLPLVFFAGDKAMIRETENSWAEEFTKPYAYHARDAQRMKNFAGQSLCNELETIIQHKWTMPVEGLPDNSDYHLAYTQPQKANVLFYNQFKDNDTTVPLNPPREIQRVPIPPELMNTFVMCDKLIQTILGTYDAAMGQQGNEVASGKAMLAGAMNSNAASKPYMLGFIAGYNRCAQIYLNLLPKYYITPRTIPIVTPKGKREYYEINKAGNVKFDYDVNCLEVTIEAGVNFEVQKQIALETILKLMQSSEVFAEFINSEGLEVLLDNIDIRGIDTLKNMASEFMENKKKQMQQAQQQQAQMPSPQDMMKMQMEMEQQKMKIEEEKLAQKQKEAEMKTQVQMTQIEVSAASEAKKDDIKFLEVMSKIQGADVQQAIEQEKLDAEQERTAVDLAISMSAHHMEGEKHEKEMKEPMGATNAD